MARKDESNPTAGLEDSSRFRQKSSGVLESTVSETKREHATSAENLRRTTQHVSNAASDLASESHGRGVESIANSNVQHDDQNAIESSTAQNLPPRSNQSSSNTEDDLTPSTVERGYRTLASVPNDMGMASSPSMSPAQGRLSPDRHERSPSPTKGMGGFVQSAMLRRSDSLNKRWSAQGTAGLNRAYSSASNRSSTYGNPEGIVTSLSSATSTPKLERSPTVPSKENSPSRLLSYSSVGDLKSAAASQVILAGGPPSPGGVNTGFLKSLHTRSRSTLSITTDAAGEQQEKEPSSPTSPTKRFSPVKSSWLESALTKPDHSKPLTLPAQPTWLSDLNKSRLHRGSRDLTQHDTISTSTLDVATESSPVADLPASARFTSVRRSRPPPPETKPKPTILTGEQTSAQAQLTTMNSLKEPDVSSVSSFQGTSGTNSSNAYDRKDTSPKIDFRATLRSRQAPSAKASDQQLEFQNVFGKLRSTQRETSSSIGHKPVHMKQSLSAALEARRIGSSETKVSITPEMTKPAFLAVVKEGFKDKSKMFATTLLPDASVLNTNTSFPATNIDDEANTPVDNLADKPPAKISDTSRTLADKFNPGLVHLLNKRQIAPSVTETDILRVTNSKIVHSDANAAATPLAGQTLQHMTKDRARGPKRRAPNSKTAVVEAPVSQSLPKTRAPFASNAVRNPTSVSQPLVADTSDATPADPALGRSTTPIERERVGERVFPPTHSQNKPHTSPKPPRISALPSHPKSNGINHRSPSSSTSSVTSRKPSKPTSLQSVRVASRATSTTTTTTTDPDEQSLVGSSENWQAVPDDISEDMTKSATPSVRNMSASWGRSTSLQARELNQVKSPIKLPTHADEQEAKERAGLGSQPASGKENISPTSPPSVTSTAGGSPPAKAAKVLPRPTSSVNASAKPSVRKPSSSLKVGSTVASLSRQTGLDKSSNATIRPVGETPLAAREIYAEFFQSSPRLSPDTDLQISSFLNDPTNDTPKTKTLRTSISELSTDGKLRSLPANHNHILSSDSMYICTHIFGDTRGIRTSEVYHWIGASVPEANIIDAAGHGRRLAKEQSGTFHSLRQGHESSNFLQAIGGILITRSGPRDSSSDYILCCRRHSGHIVFDEVAFSPESLCSGFAFLISAKNSLYLWAGRGCAADELGCARLIAMDMAPTASVNEIVDGGEPAEFLAHFPSAPAAIPESADYWTLKPQHDGYTSRLFHIEATAPAATPARASAAALWSLVRRQSQLQTVEDSGAAASGTVRVVEIVPYGQADLEPDSVYVLDAFFEIYV